MEQQVLGLLRVTQNVDKGTRLQAEDQLKTLYDDPKFPDALINIATLPTLSITERLVALVVLKLFLVQGWSSSLDEFGGRILVDDGTKHRIKQRLLALVFEDNVDSKIINQTAVIIANIAKSDYPAQWPNLLDVLFELAITGNDVRTEASLVVLAMLLQDGFDAFQFLRQAADMIKSFRELAGNPNSKLLVRAHVISVFRLSLESIETLKLVDEDECQSLVAQIREIWTPLFVEVLNAPMPTVPTDAQEREQHDETAVQWRGIIAVKTQAIMTLAKIQSIDPDVLSTQELFTACWKALQAHGAPYFACFVDGKKEEHLVTQYELAFSLDLLVVEELDFLITLLDAPAVKARMEIMSKAAKEGNENEVTKWISDLMGVLVTFSIITSEQQELWDIDFNVFLSEETLADANNTARNVCASFIHRICSWLPEQSLNSILGYMRLIWEDPESSWRYKESALYVLQQVVLEYEGENRAVPDSNILDSCVQYVATALTSDQYFLRARGHTAMAAIMTAWVAKNDADAPTVLQYAQKSLTAMSEDNSDIVKVSCIRTMSSYLNAIPTSDAANLQASIVSAISVFVFEQDLSDMDDILDLVDTVLQTLRDLIMASPTTCLDHDGLGLIIDLAKHGASRDASTHTLVEEAFESAATGMAQTGPLAYERLCSRVLPPLLGVLECVPTTKDELEDKSAPLEMALNLIKILAAMAVDKLPAGFIEITMPPIFNLVFQHVDDFFLYQVATLALKEMVHNDHITVFNWVDPVTHKDGLAMLLSVTAHLLDPNVDDVAAAEVGDLAVEIVEKAGAERLGESMHGLLHALAARLDTAEHISLIQSLVMVFARLSLMNALEVINFLKQITVGPANNNGLAVVAAKWLENCAHFAGFDAIRQSVTALVTIYGLHDPHFTTIPLRGDLIVDPATSSRIKTRSMSKAQPDRYTSISAELKLVKVLVNELVVPLAGPVPAGNRRFSTGSDTSWSTESDASPDLSPIKADDETQTYLVEFFAAVGADAHFQQLFAQLTEEEKTCLREAVQSHQLALAQQQFLGQ
ncbi:hypothetical protein MMC13_005432 [Lambiella insularis]|nr:hypothetical protein [Lambiella insularis]